MRGRITERLDLVEWGTATELIVGLATLGALIVAIRLLRREANRDKAREQASRAEQANQVAAWVGWVDDLPNPLIDRPMPGHGCVAFNSSRLPVYDALLFYSAANDEGAVTPLGASETIDLIEPGKHSLEVPSAVMDQWEDQRTAGVKSRLQVEMKFRDAAGTYWRRAVDGVLVEHDSK